MKKLKLLIPILGLLLLALPAGAQISGTTWTQSYTCNGSSTGFSFSFPIYDSYDATVKVTTGTTVTTLTPVSQYTMAPSSYYPYTYASGGQVTLLLGSSCPSGSTLSITRATPMTQTTVYSNNQAIDQTILLSDLDKIYMVMQENAIPATNVTGPASPRINYIPRWTGIDDILAEGIATPIADAYISSAANWNTAYGWGNPSGVYLPIAGTATNSSKLNGQSASYYQTALGYTPYNSTNPSSYIPLTALSSTATGLTYTNTTGVFSLTSGYAIPTTTQVSNWNDAYGWGNPAGVYQPILTNPITLHGTYTAGHVATFYGTNQIQDGGTGGGGGDMLLATIQEVSAEKKFDNSTITMKGTSTGKNTISVANTSATNYTNTLPAKGGTFAMTSDALLLDQTTPQTVTGGRPSFSGGLSVPTIPEILDYYVQLSPLRYNSINYYIPKNAAAVMILSTMAPHLWQYYTSDG